MKIFISWSGEVSEKIASLLREYLPKFSRDIKPFVSSHDIEAGEKWILKMTGELNTTNYGIICFTPLNIQSPWMHFEAGAISKLDGSSVFSLVTGGLSIDDVPPPLNMFQNSLFKKDHFKKIIFTINEKCKELNEHWHDSNELNMLFDAYWSEIEMKYKEILTDSSVEIKNSLSSLANKQNAGFFVRSYINVYDKDFIKDLEHYLNTAKKITLVGVCLVVFKNTAYTDTLIKRTKNEDIKVTLCLGDPTSESVMSRIATQFEGKIHGDYIAISEKQMESTWNAIKKEGANIDLLIFDYYLEFATMIFDDDIFVYPYGYKMPGTVSPVFHFKNNGSGEAKFFIESTESTIKNSMPIDTCFKSK